MGLNERLAELSRMKTEGNLTDQQFATLVELAKDEEQKRIAKFVRMKDEGLLSDQEFATLSELANKQDSESARLIELARMNAEGILSDQEFETLTELAKNQSTKSNSSISSNNYTSKATPPFPQTKLLIGSAVAIVAVVVSVGFFVLGNNSDDSDKGQKISTTEVYEERVRVLTTMLGMSSSELAGYAITCGIDLGDVTVPFDYVRSVLVPVLTPEQLNKSFADALLLIDKPRCLYAQGK
jgi:hypothetical protein